MLSRREWLIGAGLGAAYAAAGSPALVAGTATGKASQGKASQGKATSPWPPYRDTFAIDGASSFGFSYIMDDAAATAKELELVRAAGMGAVLTTVAPQGRFWLNDDAFERAKKEIAKWQTIAAQHPDHLFIVRSAADLKVAERRQRSGVIMGFQGTEPLGEDADRIPMFRELGVRVIQLTHNRRNIVGDGCTEPGNAGLSNYGHTVVERLNAEKVVLDLAHGAPRTIAEGIAAARAPMLISHTGCRALADLPRNTSDAELKAMADKGGVAGMIFWPYLRVDTQPMAVDVIRHIEHAVKVCGEDHVGIGTDLGVAPIERTPQFEKDNIEYIKAMVDDGIFNKGRPENLYLFIPDLNLANRFEVLAGMLSARGHSDARIGKILGGNFARVMGEVWG
ncbi:membrane dipeptidase [Tahibacter aquaticus]|uniref:Membrane dipeptidase n=1 Tax=Tahibacter aquaticus TaxID=520092 RepID=A0A4R6Z0K9_9GAMM|nr:membrane dipeptidase [Tahibacter aquaticus]TDR45061.1 membrane dipeptidase [Tahibacter aquaticus]